MKQLIIIFIFINFNNLAYADTKEDWNEMCTIASKNAELIMDARQLGMPMSKVIGYYIKENDTDKLFNNQMQKLVIEAYEESRYSTKEYQKRASEDFRDKAFLACTKAFNSKKQ